MHTLRLIAGLQVVIILLLCLRQERRRFALLWLAVIGAAGAAFKYIVRPSLTELHEAALSVLGKHGVFYLAIFGAVLVFAVLLVIAYRMDTKKNREKAGSASAKGV
jgi:uncharacterized membrane protein